MRRLIFAALLQLGFGLAMTCMAAPLELPKNAIPDDTFFVATLDLAKATPNEIDATLTAAMGDRAAEAAPFVENYRQAHAAAIAGGAQSATFVFHGDPHNGDTDPIVYLRYKSGSDHAAAEQQWRNVDGVRGAESSWEGDVMLFRKKGVALPSSGSADRTKLFADGLAASDKAIAAIFAPNTAIVAEFKESASHGMPRGLLTLVKDAQSIRIELATGASAKVVITLQGVNADAAKRIADALSGFAEMMRAQVDEAKRSGRALAPEAQFMIQTATALADALKPTLSGDNVTLTADPKVIGATLLIGGRAQPVEPTKVEAPKPDVPKPEKAPGQ
jgi:hypothetical protein